MDKEERAKMLAFTKEKLEGKHPPEAMIVVLLSTIQLCLFSIDERLERMEEKDEHKKS